jgi:tetratricopeptide (TPR) repeat protein
VNYLERLIKIPPQDKDPNVWDALASAYVNAGMIPEAMKATEKADNLRKGN